VVSVELPPHPSSATRARRLTCEHVASCPPEVVDVVALLVTELVSNAVLHAHADLHLDVAVHTDRVRLCVEVRSACGAVVVNVDAEGNDDTSGRGLALVEMLATAWGVDHVLGGKLVWCDVAFPGACEQRD
jgi:anti-sigma regulatory factor (Ser/Thr protein kinase)